MSGIRHETSCDHTTLGWMVLLMEELRGPGACLTVGEIREWREVYRDEHPDFPQCECGRRQISTLTDKISQARKRGDTDGYQELLAERRDVKKAWAAEAARRRPRRSRRTGKLLVPTA